jgi:hypothetical protein
MGPLHKIIHGKIAHFVNQAQLFPYCQLGAVGCWSIDAWMGPWPVLRVYDAITDGDYATAMRVIDDLNPGGGGRPAEGEGGGGGNPQELAGYVKPGNRVNPSSFGPQGDGERARKRAERWVELCKKYRPEVEARRLVHAG